MEKYRYLIILLLLFVLVLSGTVIRTSAKLFQHSKGVKIDVENAVWLPFLVNFPTPLSTPTPTLTQTQSPPPSTSTPTPTPTITPTYIPSEILEDFEDPIDQWVVFPDASGPSAVVEQSDLFAAEGLYSARTSTSSSSDEAQIRINFSDPASAHQWNERPGTWHWQQASVYLPSSSIDQLGPGEYFTIAGMWPSNGGPFGWFLRVHQNGSLYAFGYTKDGNPIEFNIYGSFPLDQWVELELGRP